MRAYLPATAYLLLVGAASAADVRFLVFGDFGEHGSDQQRPVAEALGRVATNAGPLDFVLTTGDNIYSHGITDVRDPLWKSNLNDIYTAASLDVPWYGTMGSACPGRVVCACVLDGFIPRKSLFPRCAQLARRSRFSL